MSIDDHISKKAGNLIVSSEEKNKIQLSTDTIKERLNSYFSNCELKNKIIFGSYPRETILPRSIDENSDIDMMVVFSNPNNYLPQTFLNKLKSFVEYYYTRSEIYQSSPTIVLELQHIKFELVPAVHYYGDVFQIPDGPSQWMTTNPTEFNNTLSECNKNNGYKIKKVIRLLKNWNIAKNYRYYSSYLLEQKITNALKFCYITGSGYTHYLKSAFNSLETYNTSRINTAIGHIDKAIDYENQGMPYWANSEIDKIFE